ncbi:MAG: hypothetical protein MH252_03520 [Thermosynechococcaceae cyanobacterium MS004]|nr:hypothetical protein [Thermosynechococcaceae cyanobacterium MS004]
MAYYSSDSRFPLWAYLNQPIFDPTTPLILHPQQFVQHSRVKLLERCLSLTPSNNRFPHA